jgi:hypothetical protein
MYRVEYQDRGTWHAACYGAESYGGTMQGVLPTHADALAFRNERKFMNPEVPMRIVPVKLGTDDVHPLSLEAMQ